MPADGVIALDPEAARQLATALRMARDAWRRDADELVALAGAGDLITEIQPAVDALVAAAGDGDLAATDLDLRVELLEALDRGDGLAAVRSSVAAAAAITRWEAAVAGGVDEAVVTTTVTTGADFVSRFSASDPQVVGAGVACLDDSYRVRGELVGPDGRRYRLTTPQVGHVADGERRAVNADWGPAPPGLDVWTLDGADPGWVTVAREQGIGQLAPAATGGDFFLAGAAGRVYARSSGYTPASLAAHAELTLDRYGVPTEVRGQRGGTIHLVESVDEIVAHTPVMVRAPGGQPRFEQAATGRGAGAVGVAELVGLAAEAGLTANHVRQQGNYAYVVRYQEHPDGRRRAIPVVYHLALDGDGEPVAFMGYLAPGTDGELRAELLVPRRHGDYRPAITVNPTT